jgi:ankyrin repeat protein
MSKVHSIYHKALTSDIEEAAAKGYELLLCPTKNTSVLASAARNGHYDIVKYILSCGAIPTIGVFMAAHISKSRLIIDAVNEAARSKFNDRDALEAICESGNIELLQTFSTDVLYPRLIENAAKSGRVDMVKYLMSVFPHSPILVDDYVHVLVNTASTATRDSGTELMRYLGHLFYDPHDILRVRGPTEYHLCGVTDMIIHACTAGNTGLVNVIIDMSGCDINIGNGIALETACEYEHTELVKYLMDRGARSSNAPEIACAHGNIDCMNLLISKGYSVPLMLRYVARHGQLRLMEYLAQNGGRICGSDYLLLDAAQSGNVSMMKYLIRLGLNYRNYSSEIIEIANRYRRTRLLRYLTASHNI